jgi:membrane-bound lytic murein transglycosylase B
VTRVFLRHSAILTAVLLLFGCGGDSSVARTNYYSGLKPLPKVSHPAAARPSQQPDLTTRQYSHDYAATALSGDYRYSASLRDFIRHMVQRHGFNEAYLNGLFSQAKRLYSVIRLETEQQPSSPPRPGSWTRYRSKFLTAEHISNGVRFWLDNAGAVERASATYGVDPEYIVAIIGVETYFGRNVGKTRIFDALTTLAFDTQRRAAFFTAELENFLLMTREEDYDPLQPVGSWAGAMGLGQFMPSSFRNLAVDFDGDGKRNLWQSRDAIGSVAHYFNESGWRMNEPIAERAGYSSGGETIALSTYNGDEYWRVYANFKVIKKYNNSDKYAMAVHQLAQAIKQQYYKSL